MGLDLQPHQLQKGSKMCYLCFATVGEEAKATVGTAVQGHQLHSGERAEAGVDLFSLVWLTAVLSKL